MKNTDSKQEKSAALNKKATDFFDKMREVNPKGGMKEFIRMSFEGGYNAAQQRIAELEQQVSDLETALIITKNSRKSRVDENVILKAELKRKDEALEFVQLYLSTKSPEGFEAFTVIEEALKPNKDE